MSEKTRAIGMHTLNFGVLGSGLDVTHRSAHGTAAKALKRAKNVLTTTAGNVESAEEAGKGRGQASWACRQASSALNARMPLYP